MISGSRVTKWIPAAFEPGLVSIIIPTYNRLAYLAEALKSVREQSHRPLEVVVVDDGSTDNTMDFVRAFADRAAEPRKFSLRLVQQARQGAQAARNRGAIECCGEYLQFLDSDDILLPQKISRGIALLSPEAAISYCRTQGVDDALRPLADSQFGQARVAGRNDIADYTWHTSGPLYRRTAIAALGPWLEGITGSQDWEYGARAKLLGITSVFDEEVGSLFRIHTGERISLRKFDHAYNLSAEQAYDHIVGLARRHGALDRPLGGRFVRLYLSRAMEFHEAGFVEDRNRCLKKAIELPTDEMLIRIVALLSTKTPNRRLIDLAARGIRLRRELKSSACLARWRRFLAA